MGIGLVPGIILYIVICAFLIYTFILNDASTSPISHCVTVTIPTYIISLLRKILGEQNMRKLETLSDYFLVTIYLIIVLGSWSIMFTFGYTFIQKSNHVSNYHQYSGYCLFVLCMWSWRKASDTSPGYINSHNLVRFDNYPYDDLLFVGGKLCPTVGIRKLARSKYDRCTNRHVARFDHYCGWIHNAVGEENYRYFLLFLSVHVGMCAYGTIITLSLFLGEVQDKDLMNAIFYNGKTGQEVQADFWVVFHYMLMKHFELSAVLLLMAVMALVLCLFLLFHLYISANGMTTNEFFKWRQVRKWYKVEVHRYERALKEGKIDKDGNEVLLSNSTTSSLSTSSAAGTSESTSKKAPLNDVDVGCVGPIHNTGENTHEKEQEEEVMAKVCHPGPFPVNVYNRGIVENFKEIIFPRSLRRDALIRLAEARRNGQIPNTKKSSTATAEVVDKRGKPKET